MKGKRAEAARSLTAHRELEDSILGRRDSYSVVLGEAKRSLDSLQLLNPRFPASFTWVCFDRP